MIRTENLRVAVITTDSRPVSNYLWYGARALVGDLIVFGPRTQDDESPDPEIHTVFKSFDFGRGLIWRHLRGLNPTLDKFQPHLIHVNGELWGLTCQELLKRRELIVAHGAENIWYHGGQIERHLRRALIDRAFKHIAGYVSWNQAGADYVKSRQPTHFPIHTAPAIIPPMEYRRNGWQKPASGRTVELLLVGSLRAQKGFDVALRAAQVLKSTHPVRIRVCGEGPLRGELRRLGEELQVDLVFMGDVNAKTLADCMSGATFLIQCSRSTPDVVEQFGRSVSEAMTVGLPALVSSSGELPYLVGFDKNAIFPEEDSAELARLIRQALAYDCSGLEQLSKFQQQRAKRWTPEIAGTEMVRFWERVMRARH